MAMRVVVTFPRPLDAAASTALRIALGGMAACRRVVIARDGRSAIAMGEALGTHRVARTLAEGGVAVAAITTSLSPEEDPAEFHPSPKGHFGAQPRQALVSRGEAPRNQSP